MYKLIGGQIPIRDARYKVNGEIKYSSDIEVPGMLYGRLVLSTIPHGKVLDIDSSKALELEGVVGIVTAEDLPLVKYNSAIRFKGHNILKTENILSDVVRFVGDRIALVVADNPKTAEKAAKLVTVTYEEYPSVFDEEDAIAENAPVLHLEEAPDNKVVDVERGASEVDVLDAISKSEHVFTDKIKLPMVSPAPIETYVVLGDYREGKATVYTGTQNTFAQRVIISEVFNLPYSKVRVVQTNIGGSFGSKVEIVTELVAIGASKKFGKPVKVIMNRKENMVATRTRNGATMWVKTGVNAKGELQGLDFKIITNTGAYATSGANILFAMSSKVLKCYKAPVHFRGIAALTNLPIAGAMRGYGSPQAFYGIQLHLDRVARQLGLDPMDFLLKNVYNASDVDPEDFGNPQLDTCLKRGKELFKWEQRQKDVKLHNEKSTDVLRGIGVSIGAHGNGMFGAHQDGIGVSLRLNEDGTFNYWAASHEMGNGALTAQAIIIAEILGVMPDAIEPVIVDTETCPWNLASYGSRGVFVEGSGALKAAELLKKEILETASIFYQLPEDSLSLENGNVLSQQGEVLGSLSSVASFAQQKLQKELMITTDFHSTKGRTSYGAHFAEVEVNKTTGEVKVIDYVAVHDVGKVINRMGIEGQLEGGIQMGIGYALREKMTFNSQGKLEEADFKKYQMIKAHEMPQIKLDFIEEGDTGGPFGAKSIGECATVPVAPTVINGVINALGGELTIFPLNPEEIKSLIK